MLFWKKKTTNLEFGYPVNGTARPVSELEDGVFSEHVLGNGFFVCPAEEKEVVVRSFCNAKVDSVFETKHAVTLVSNGMNILLHFGLDTVELDGEGFEVLVSAGQKVKIGEPLMKVNLELLKGKGYRTECIVIFPEMDDYEIQLMNTEMAGMLVKKA